MFWDAFKDVLSGGRFRAIFRAPFRVSLKCLLNCTPGPEVGIYPSSGGDCRMGESQCARCGNFTCNPIKETHPKWKECLARPICYRLTQLFGNEILQTELISCQTCCLCSMATLCGPKLLLAMGCVKLGKKNCGHLPSVSGQNANKLANFTQPIASNNFGPSTC